jgi:hypothetical protein
MVPAIVLSAGAALPAHAQQSVARQWNDEVLEAIRHDFARPTVHARNLWHTSMAMYDAWATYDDVADTFLFNEDHSDDDIEDVEEAQAEAVSFACYRMIQARYGNAPGWADIIKPAIDGLMDDLGYDKSYKGTIGNSPAAIGNRIAYGVINYGFNDNANEQGGFANLVYEPVNPPILPDFPGNPDLIDPQRWQPIALDYFKDQGGNIIIGGYPEALSHEWGQVTPFSLRPEDLTIYHDADLDYDWWVYMDPGPPPVLNQDAYYKWGFEMVSIWTGHLDPTDGVMIDISPASFGNSPLPGVDEWADYYNFYEGGDWSPGYKLNPVTGEPYEPQVVPRGDYARCLAEFWADGPQSETPPGHWFSIMNYVMDHPLFEKKLEGKGQVLGDLEFDVKTYFALGGAMHDAAITAWGMKGFYDFIRPISSIRWMADQGQCTDPNLPSFSKDGIDLHPDWIELVTPETTAPGQKHEHLAGNEGKIALYTWRGHDYINDPEIDVAGVGWILAENWWPYQRPSFVTPPFSGYISGHSTYSRTAAELLTVMTGSPYFPGGVGEFFCPQNEFLVFEDGPSQDLTLQWASYRDASDQTSMSRIWGSIHPPCDDLPGRHVGVVLGPQAWNHADHYYHGLISCPTDFNGDDNLNILDFVAFQQAFVAKDNLADINGDGNFSILDFVAFQIAFGKGCK